MFGATVSSVEELESLMGRPSPLVQHKVISRLDPHCRDFLSKASLLFIGTADAQGAQDVSPRGDVPGFVRVLDDSHLLIPERPGNRRMDSLKNLLANPQIGLVCVIPGLGETLRINGVATITRDANLLEPSAIAGRPPLIGIGVAVRECYFHCAKAFLRSHAWDPCAWLDPNHQPDIARALAVHAQRAKVTRDEVDRALQESYTTRLY